ncbi:MAG: carboxypeptidase regulatory-like domain-containing protein [Bacteroidales bacterium]|jgi:hypothetical protein|nr:carboxypeptidase regulatory-like domain-containing protein [Bacteroidales bacterium]
MKKLLKQIFLTSGFMFMAAVMAYGQGATTSSLSGKITDSSGESLPGASIVATHTPSGTQYATIADNAGNYRITNMRVGGPYTVNVSFIGYATQSYTEITLKLGETYVQNGQVAESATSLAEVVVTAGARNSILSSERTGAQTNVSGRDLAALPTITRSITDFAKYTPQSQGNSFGGRDARYNTITVDGAAFNNNFGLSSNPLPGGSAQPISLDAIEEISVSVAPYDVTKSQFTGASINAVTRSGDNTLKGSVYTYMRPKSFTGNTVDGNEITGANDRNSQNYGLRLGGPIIKNKLFFFVSGEYEKESIPGIQWRAAKAGESQDENLKISRTTEADMILVKNHLMSKYGYDPGAYNNFEPFQNKNTKLLARIDWNISKDHKFTLRYNDVVGTSDVETNPNSGPPNLPRNSGRISQQSMAFSNSFYGFKNVVRSITGELNSNFGSRISNKLLVSNTSSQDTRTSDSDIFPFVDIWEGGDQYMSFGYELFTYGNDVQNKTFSITDNATINLNRHTVTAGAAFDRLWFKNSYIREGTSYYRYASVDDFINDRQPTGFGITYGYNGADAPGAEATFGLGALYAQDEWNATSKLKLTLGLRVELPFYFGNPTDNPAISSIDFAGRRIDVGTWPDPQVTFSPRFGFNYDVKGDRSLQIRGGSGLFTGLLPFVWFTNQPTNSGTIQVPEIGLSGQALIDAGITSFNPNYKELIGSNANFPAAPGALPGGSGLAQVSKDFKLPQVWRSNVAVDVELPWNTIFTAEAMFSKDVNTVIQQNINEAPAQGNLAGPDNRPIWTSSSSIVSTVGTAMELSNASEGYQYSITGQLTKNFSNGLSGMFAYTYTQAKDLTSNPGSAAASAWTSNTAVGSLNSPGLSYSNFATPHKLVGNISYRVEYAKFFATTISVVYQGYNTGRWSYTYSNDLNGDRNSSDLMYIPKSKDEIKFVEYVNEKDGVRLDDASAQADAFWNYINGNEYLSSRKGRYAERFGEVKPWLNRFDIKFLQDIYSTFGSNRKYTLQFSFDLLNAGNLINDKWGVYTYNPLASYDNVRPLTVVNKGSTTEAPTFRLNANSVDDFKKKTTLGKDLSTASTWGALFGIRLIF